MTNFKSLILTILVAAIMLMASCATLHFKTSNLIKLHTQDGAVVICSLENSNHKNMASCQFARNGFTYDCSINVENSKVINLDENCVITSTPFDKVKKSEKK